MRHPRLASLLILGLLPGCGLEGAALPVAAVGAASVAVAGQTPVDMAASWYTGRDCSIVRLDRRESYCAPPALPVTAQPYCTRSRGSVDCWVTPPLNSTPVGAPVVPVPPLVSTVPVPMQVVPVPAGAAVVQPAVVVPLGPVAVPPPEGSAPGTPVFVLPQVAPGDAPAGVFVPTQPTGALAQ
jgi:hypothetical protein